MPHIPEMYLYTRRIPERQKGHRCVVRRETQKNKKQGKKLGLGGCAVRLHRDKSGVCMYIYVDGIKTCSAMRIYAPGVLRRFFVVGH